jgi:hypothetical protein
MLHLFWEVGGCQVEVAQAVLSRVQSSVSLLLYPFQPAIGSMDSHHQSQTVSLYGSTKDQVWPVAWESRMHGLQLLFA